MTDFVLDCGCRWEDRPGGPLPDTQEWVPEIDCPIHGLLEYRDCFRIRDLGKFGIPLTFIVAATSDPWEHDWGYDPFEYLPGVTFTPHDDDHRACICANPMRPYRNCPAHRGRAHFMERAGIELEGWRR